MYSHFSVFEPIFAEEKRWHVITDKPLKTLRLLVHGEGGGLERGSGTQPHPPVLNRDVLVPSLGITPPVSAMTVPYVVCRLQGSSFVMFGGQRCMQLRNELKPSGRLEQQSRPSPEVPPAIALSASQAFVL